MTTFYINSTMEINRSLSKKRISIFANLFYFTFINEKED